MAAAADEDEAQPADADGATPEQLEELRQDEVIQGALGPIADAFIDFKIKEWETYDLQITPWEVNEYLTFF